VHTRRRRRRRNVIKGKNRVTKLMKLVSH
jgi:hypothetical protein